MIISIEFNRSFNRNFLYLPFQREVFLLLKYYRMYNLIMRIIQYKCKKFVINVNGILVEKIIVMLYN